MRDRRDYNAEYYDQRAAELRARSNERRRSLSPERKAQAAARLREWRKANPDRVREHHERYQRKKPDVVAAGKARWYRANKAKSKASARAYARRLRSDVLVAYGGRCACCQETEPDFLTIDHAYNDGAEHKRTIGTTLYQWLKNNGYPKDRFRLLCMNCNFARGKYGTCPHERKLKLVQP